jgi:hypothetical protein
VQSCPHEHTRGRAISDRLADERQRPPYTGSIWSRPHHGRMLCCMHHRYSHSNTQHPDRGKIVYTIHQWVNLKMDTFVLRLFASDTEDLDTRSSGKGTTVHMFTASCLLTGRCPHGTYAALVFNPSASRTHCCGAATPIACPANFTPYTIWCSKVSSRTTSVSSQSAKPNQGLAIQLLQFWLCQEETEVS